MPADARAVLAEHSTDCHGCREALDLVVRDAWQTGHDAARERGRAAAERIAAFLDSEASESSSSHGEALMLLASALEIVGAPP